MTYTDKWREIAVKLRSIPGLVMILQTHDRDQAAALRKQFPRADAFLRYETDTYTHLDGLREISRRALQRVINGDDLDDIKNEHESAVDKWISCQR